MINPESPRPELSIKKAEKLKSLEDLELTKVQARLDDALASLLEVFIDEQGVLMELTKSMAVELVMAGQPLRSASTYNGDLFSLLIRHVNRAQKSPLFFETSKKNVGKDGRPTTVYRLSYK